MEKGKNLEVVHQGKGGVIPLNPEEEKLYQILDTLPKPETSMRLSTAQKKWWYWFGYEFIKTKQFSKLDLMHLQQAAFWMDARSQAYKKINTEGYEGLVQTFKTGATNVTGHISIVEKADKHLGDVSAHFGLSIRDRQKLKKSDEIPTGQLDLWDMIMNKKQASN